MFLNIKLINKLKYEPKQLLLGILEKSPMIRFELVRLIFGLNLNKWFNGRLIFGVIPDTCLVLFFHVL